MTNKNAKDILFKQWQEFLENNVDYAGVSDAYKLAFKLLECEDVLLNKIIEEIEHWESDNDNETDPYQVGAMDMKNYVFSVITKYKSISIKPKHWIHRNDDMFDWLECPSCGYGSEGEVKYREGTPYCPHCGERLEDARD